MIQWTGFPAAVDVISSTILVGLATGTTNGRFNASSLLLKANNLNDVANAVSAFGNISPTTTRGDMIYRGASANQRLAIGTAGYFLLAGANDPTWTAPTAAATALGLGTGSSPTFVKITTTGINVGSVTDAITAQSGGGQGSAVALTTAINRVTTVAVAGDSVKLPAAAAGLQVTVINAAAANAMDCFPASGDAINALAPDTALSIAVGSPVIFTCAVAGTWDALVGA